MDLRQTPQYAKYLKDLKWIVEEKDGVYYFIKKIPVLGSVIKIQRPKTVNLNFIDELAKKHRAFQIIIEPIQTSNFQLLTSNSYKLAKSSYLPTKTTVIDLKLSEEEMLKRMHYKTRYNIKKAKNLKLRVQKSNDINLFADFWQNCALKQRGMYIPQKKEIHAMYKAFKNKCSLVFVFPPLTTHSPSQRLYRAGGHTPTTIHPLSAVFSVYTSDTAFYMFAAATAEGKKLFAPTLAAWESIKIAKKKGLKYYDFEGVFDERFPLPSWKGFSRFKLSFGGKIIEYPGSFVKMRLPI